LSAFTIVFGELIPKVFAIENKEWVCLKLALSCASSLGHLAGGGDFLNGGVNRCAS